jgi:hypothetical protein
LIEAAKYLVDDAVVVMLLSGPLQQDLQQAIKDGAD